MNPFHVFTDILFYIIDKLVYSSLYILLVLKQKVLGHMLHKIYYNCTKQAPSSKLYFLYLSSDKYEMTNIFFGIEVEMYKV